MCSTRPLLVSGLGLGPSQIILITYIINIIAINMPIIISVPHIILHILY